MYSLKQVRKIKVLQNAPGVGREEGWSVGLLVGLSVSPMQSPPSYEHSVIFSLQSQDNRLYVSFQFQKIDFNFILNLPNLTIPVSYLVWIYIWPWGKTSVTISSVKTTSRRHIQSTITTSIVDCFRVCLAELAITIQHKKSIYKFACIEFTECIDLPSIQSTFWCEVSTTIYIWRGRLEGKN